MTDTKETQIKEQQNKETAEAIKEITTKTLKKNPWLDFINENRNKDEYMDLTYKELLQKLSPIYKSQKNIPITEASVKKAKAKPASKTSKTPKQPKDPVVNTDKATPKTKLTKNKKAPKTKTGSGKATVSSKN